MRWVSCIICQEDRSDPFEAVEDRLLHVEGRFQLVRCAGCGLVYLNPQPTSEEILRYYPPEYYSYVGGRSDVPSWWHRVSRDYGLAKRCRVVTQRQRGGRILDVGCATGFFLGAMRRHGDWELYGVEPNAQAVAYAREHLGLDVFAGPLEEAVFPDEYFDAVTLWDVLEHLPNPRAALTRIRCALKPDGWIFCRVPSLDSLDARLFGPYWAGLDAPRHFYVFSQSTLGHLLDVTGFGFREFCCFGGSYPSFALSLRFWAGEKLPSGRARRLVRRLLESPAIRLAVAPAFYLLDRLRKSAALTACSQRT